MLVKTDSRICFAIRYYDDEAEAAREGAKIAASGAAYNGGYFDGMPCGRAKGWDREEGGRKLFAVTC
jgi:hypothetical protein